MPEAERAGASPREERAAAAEPGWTLPHKIAFRFFCALFVFYYFPYPLTLVPGTGRLVGFYADHWNAGVSWVGAHVLHLEGPIAELSNGSGDRLFSWVEYGCFAANALIAALIWSVLDRRRAHYRTLHGWLCILLRFQLGEAMLGYGFAKVIKNQFPAPSAFKLVERVGDLSPMGLLWTFMGYSTAYTFFAGAGEVVGGLLLFFRRTATLGVLVVIGVMSNVVLMNFSYDVSVKLYSSHLLLMALYLLAPDLQRLANLLVLNRPVEPKDLRPPYSARGLLLGGYLLKAYLLGSTVYYAASYNFARHRTVQADQARSAFNGIWKVEEFTRDGSSAAPLVTDATRWSQVIVAQGRFAQVRHADDSMSPFGFEEDAQQWLLSPRGPDPKNLPPKQKLASSRPDPEHLLLEGTFEGARLLVKLKRVDPGSFQLMSRGFHWVNDAPFNR